MKKYILSSAMAIFLVAGVSLMLTATGTKTTAKESCCSGKTVEFIQTAQTETATKATSCCSGAEKTQTASAGCAGKSAGDACCSSKGTRAEAESSEVQMIQTSSAAVEKSSCTGSATTTTTAATSGCCSGSKTTTTQTVAGPQPGECTKVPSGIRSQQANREN